MSEQFDALKAKLESITGTVDEVKKDVTFLKEKIAAGTEGGLTKDEVAELNTIVDGISGKLSSLDAETDSSVSSEEPG